MCSFETASKPDKKTRRFFNFNLISSHFISLRLASSEKHNIIRNDINVFVCPLTVEWLMRCKMRGSGIAFVNRKIEWRRNYSRNYTSASYGVSVWTCRFVLLPMWCNFMCVLWNFPSKYAWDDLTCNLIDRVD